MLSLCRTGVLAALLVLAGTAPRPAAAEDAKAIETKGSGTLTMCRSWLFFNSCHDYSNVVLPRRVAIGDKVPLAFGSNPKEYDFPVVRILRNDDRCTLLSHPGDNTDNVEKIEVASCRAASGAD